MASADKNLLTYHVVPRFDIAAEGGPLSLGTIVYDLKRLIPLNRREFHIEVPEELKYTPVTQTDVKDTLRRAREANFAAWVKAAGLPAGASAAAGTTKNATESVSCESIVTTYFDPDPSGSYMRSALAVKPVQDWLEGFDGHWTELYLITGLKIAKGLDFMKSSTAGKDIDGKVELKEPTTNAIETGAEITASREKGRELEFSVNDIVLGFRVNRYRCRRFWFRKNWTTKDKGIMSGNMMGDEPSENSPVETEFEPVPMPEEITAREKARVAGASECWIVV